MQGAGCGLWSSLLEMNRWRRWSFPALWSLRRHSRGPILDCRTRCHPCELDFSMMSFKIEQGEYLD